MLLVFYGDANMSKPDVQSIQTRSSAQMALHTAPWARLR